ncbi:hypothetical protein BC834DRAFT_912159 [Gloeopeniophorella convolvens]|nr:hypothetical protein BC834DRAFT_912159 [Gloeopeniophorella convolvens]
MLAFARTGYNVLRSPTLRMGALGPVLLSRLAHRSVENRALRQRNWGIEGNAPPRPLALSEEEPEEEEMPRRKYRHQTDNYRPASKPTPDAWAQHRAALQAKFPAGWAPPHKLSRAAMEGLRALHAADPEAFSTPVLANKFRVSPEAVRRILRSRWQPTREQRAHMVNRERRHREEHVRQRQAEARTQRMEARLQAVLSKNEREAPRGEPRKEGEPRGINKKDRFTLQ